MARSQPQRCRHRQDQGGAGEPHQRVVELLDAVPEGDVAVPLVVPVPVVLPVELPVELPDNVALPDTEPPVPVAPIEEVPLVGAPVVVSVLVLPVVVPLLLIEPVVEPGVVAAVDELVDGAEPGVVLVVEDVVLDSRFVQAPSERAATTARAAADAWVRVIFIRKLLERFAIGVTGRAAATALPRL